MKLQRIVATFSPEGIQLRVLYRCENVANLGTKAQASKTTELAREAHIAVSGPLRGV